MFFTPHTQWQLVLSPQVSKKYSWFLVTPYPQLPPLASYSPPQPSQAPLPICCMLDVSNSVLQGAGGMFKLILDFFVGEKQKWKSCSKCMPGGRGGVFRDIFPKLLWIIPYLYHCTQSPDCFLEFLLAVRSSGAFSETAGPPIGCRPWWSIEIIMLIFINMIMTMLTIKVIGVVDDHNNRTWMN